MKLKTVFWGVPAVMLLSACSAVTTYQAKQSDVQLRINSNQPVKVNAGEAHKYSTTSFGQYVFEVSKEGQSPMYGIMPLKFNGGYLAADILFFAPAAFFNLREVYPYYEFDMDEMVVRYKKKITDEWTVYIPSADEVERAKQYFKYGK